MGMSVHYKIPEGLAFDTEGVVTPAKWYYAPKECGNMKIPFTRALDINLRETALSIDYNLLSIYSARRTSSSVPFTITRYHLQTSWSLSTLAGYQPMPKQALASIAANC